MPKDQAMDFVVAEYSLGLVKERPPRDPADIAAQASQLLDDFLDREKIERHTVPSETRQLLMLLAEGCIFTPRSWKPSRISHTEGKRDMLPPGLGNPSIASHSTWAPSTSVCRWRGAHGGPLSAPPAPLLPSPGSYPKTKPPPLLSLHRPPGHHRSRGITRPPTFTSPYSSPLGVVALTAPSSSVPHKLQRPSQYRGAPPSLKSSRPPLLAAPVAGVFSCYLLLLIFCQLNHSSSCAVSLEGEVKLGVRQRETGGMGRRVGVEEEEEEMEAVEGGGTETRAPHLPKLQQGPACLSPASLPQPTRAVPSCSLRDQSAPPPGPFSHIPLLGRGYISSQALPALALLCVSAPQPRQQRQAEEEEGDW
ncbi:hypothetical protein INR49_031557 [Caranx melampygus]|nr:hypothetical protein INR49_031557 [Caranx melampygus]